MNDVRCFCLKDRWDSVEGIEPTTGSVLIAEKLNLEKSYNLLTPCFGRFEVAYAFVLLPYFSQ